MIREELNKIILEDFPIKLKKIEVGPDEFLVVKIEGEFDMNFYNRTNAILKERFGPRALVMGNSKKYNIELCVGRIKDGEDK